MRESRTYSETAGNVLRTLLCTLLLALTGSFGVHAQNLNDRNFMEYRVMEDGDTVFFAVLKPSRIYERLPRQKGKDWRQYYKLVKNFSKVYPYAVEARRLVNETDSTFEAGNLSKRKKTKYVNTIQKDLLKKYEPVLKDMTISQGKVLIKLISRETGMTPYDIIHDYKNKLAAGFWQGIAKLFSGNLKTQFNPDANEEDAQLEDLVTKWNDGDFENYYWSLFGEYPKVPVLPSKKK